MPLLEVVQFKLASDFESSVMNTQLHRDIYKEMLEIPVYYC